jgi:hypothetical protein
VSVPGCRLQGPLVREAVQALPRAGRANAMFRVA